jgi:hypothetical protein
MLLSHSPSLMLVNMLLLLLLHAVARTSDVDVTILQPYEYEIGMMKRTRIPSKYDCTMPLMYCDLLSRERAPRLQGRQHSITTGPSVKNRGQGLRVGRQRRRSRWLPYSDKYICTHRNASVHSASLPQYPFEACTRFCSVAGSRPKTKVVAAHSQVPVMT